MTDAGYSERWYGAQDGLRLYYREYGDALAPGVPLVCLTGLTRNSKDFHAFARHHASRRRVLCPDYRGRGRSAYDPDWHGYDPRNYVNDIRHLLAAANVHRAAFVGTSLGGILAMAMAVAAPTTVAGAVLNDVGPDVAPDGYGRILAYIRTDRPQPDWDSAVRELKAAFPRLSMKNDADWLEMARATFREGADGRLHFDWDVKLARPLLARRAPVPDLWPLFRALRGRPTLALRGACSDILRADTFERMAAEHPALRRVTVPEVGHAPSLAEPEARAAIDAFLTGLDAGAP